MRKIVAIICIFLTSCGGEEQNNAHKHVQSTVKVNWEIYVPLDDLVIAVDECKKYPDSYLCEKLDNQVYDISVSLETCKSQIQKSKLCNEVVAVISNHKLKKLLTQADAIALPDNPFYFSLPTLLLDSLSHRYSYRTEMWGLWIQKYQSLLYKIIFGTMTALVLWLFLIFYRSEKAQQEKIERKEIADAQEAAEQKARDDKLKEQEAAAAEAQQAEQEIIAEQQNRQREIQRAREEARLAEEKQKAAEAAEAEEREAAEKKLIEDMLKAAVKKSPKKK